MKRMILILFMLGSSTVFSQSAKESITRLMAEQEKAWNKGDIDGFMVSYWHSDSLKFIGKKGITYGWKSTLDNYKKSYPDKVTMGILKFTNLSIEPQSDTSCYVIGQWHLQREKDEVGGYYTLLWKKIDGKWVIVADHSS
ncbi:MAG: YybH family protein [Bacteroidia bacterium]